MIALYYFLNIWFYNYGLMYSYVDLENLFPFCYNVWSLQMGGKPVL
jgi:hypothetical protein